MPTDSVDISDVPDAVPVARRFASAALVRFGCLEVLDSAELVVSELVTNAVLHAGLPVRLTVVGADNFVRIEVHDRSRDIPVRSQLQASGMTGRGLALVDAVSQGWGADPTSDGKIVWAEITAASAAAEEPGDAELDALLASFEDWEDEAGPQQFTVTLGEVPTDLLLEAKAHVDSVIREMTLSATGAASGMSAALPPHLTELVHVVVTEFSSARQAIKRQAMAAAEAGSSRTTLVLTLPATAAAAGERYLAALEDADAFARASRLLTVAAPPQHRAFRRWYVAALTAGLSREISSLPPMPPKTFESYLLEQVEELAALQEISDRGARLQRVTASLATALSAEAAAEVALDDAMAALGAARGAALLLRDGVLVSASNHHHYGDEQYQQMLDAWRAPGDLPMLRAIGGGVAVWLESHEECVEQFPLLRGLEPDVDALCVIPMTVADRVVGVLRLSFAHSRLFSYDERAFLVALAAVTAQAVDRASLYSSQTRVADQLTRLQQVSSALSQVHSLDAVLDVTIAHATGLVGAQVATVSLLDDDGATVRLVRVQPPIAAADQWSAFPLAEDLPVTVAIRTGEFRRISSVAERNTRWPALTALDWGFERELIVLPLTADNATFGALTLSFAPDPGADPAREFLTAFADSCAQAIERARSAERADVANRRLAFLARASEELAVSLDVDSILANLARLAVPEIADCCTVHLLRSGEVEVVALEHVDPAKRLLALEVQRRWPERLADERGIGRVIRSGETLCLPDIRASWAAGPPAGRDPDYQELLQQLDPRSVISVPLRGRSNTLGALTFVSSDSGHRYTAGDQSLVEDLARRAGIAIENVGLHRESAAGALGQLESTAFGRGRSRSDPVLEAASIGRFEFNLTEGTIDADEIVSGLFALTAQDDGSRLETYLSRIHPEDSGRVEEEIGAAVEAGGSYRMEFRVLLPDGAVRWLAARGRALTDVTGRPGRVAGVMYAVLADRDRRDELARLLETMTDAFYRLDREWRFTFINSQAERRLFRPRGELLGRSLWDCFPELVGTSFESECRQAQLTGARVELEMYYPRLLSWFEARVAPDSDGLSVFFHDITARKQAEDAKASANERLALLGEAARGLVGTLDVETVMHQVASVVVPRLADWAVLMLIDAGGQPQGHHGLHYDAVIAAEVARVAELAGDIVASTPALERVLRTGIPLRRAAIDIRSATEGLPGGELAGLLETLGFASVVVVPMQAGVATIGLLVLVNGPVRTPFDDEDVNTAVDIGRRAGLALENAQLSARQRNASEVLQRSLLTPLPEPPYLHVVARYRPAGQEAQIGGDWYDAFMRSDGATVLAIGDVVGHDMNAAAAMGQLRNLLRGVAFDSQDPPAVILRRVDAAIRGLRIDTLATAVVGRMAQTSEQHARSEQTFQWSNAGHPPPMVLRADGTVIVLDGTPDLLLGWDPETDRHDNSVVMGVGDTLLLYTDGLVERRDSPIDEGLARLQVALGDLVDVDLECLCDELVARLLPADADDDVALVAVRARREDGPRSAGAEERAS